MNARDLIKRHEGLRLIAYVDTRGVITIGWGHRIYAAHFKSPISQIVADQLFEDDYGRALAGVQTVLGYSPSENTPIGSAIIDMCFELGANGLRGFVHMLAAIQKGDYAGAADAVMDSRYAHQVPGRAHEISTLLRTGDWGCLTDGGAHG